MAATVQEPNQRSNTPCIGPSKANSRNKPARSLQCPIRDAIEPLIYTLAGDAIQEPGFGTIPNRKTAPGSNQDKTALVIEFRPARSDSLRGAHDQRRAPGIGLGGGGGHNGRLGKTLGDRTIARIEDRSPLDRRGSRQTRPSQVEPGLRRRTRPGIGGDHRPTHPTLWRIQGQEISGQFQQSPVHASPTQFPTGFIQGDPAPDPAEIEAGLPAWQDRSTLRSKEVSRAVRGSSRHRARIERPFCMSPLPRGIFQRSVKHWRCPEYPSGFSIQKRPQLGGRIEEGQGRLDLPHRLEGRADGLPGLVGTVGLDPDVGDLPHDPRSVVHEFPGIGFFAANPPGCEGHRPGGAGQGDQKLSPVHGSSLATGAKQDRRTTASWP